MGFLITPEMFEKSVTPKQRWRLLGETGVKTTTEHIRDRSVADQMAMLEFRVKNADVLSTMEPAEADEYVRKHALSESKWLSIGEASTMIKNIEACEKGSDTHKQCVMEIRERLAELSVDKEAALNSPLPTVLAKDEFQEVFDAAKEAGENAAVGISGDTKGIGNVLLPGRARFTRYLKETNAIPASGDSKVPAMYCYLAGDGSLAAAEAYGKAFCEVVNNARLEYGEQGKTVKAEFKVQQVG